jgi:signal transduction histidine kinase
MRRDDHATKAQLSSVNDVLYYLLFLSVVVRAGMTAVQQGFQLWVQAALLAAFLLLSLLQPTVQRRLPALMQPLLGLSAALATLLMFTQPRLDYFALLYIVLSLAAHRYLPLSTIPYWLAGLCVLPAAALFLVFGLAEGLPYVPTYVAGVLFIGLYGRANRKAEEARAKSEELLGRLQESNRRLKIYAERAEEVAAAQERTQMARELHDAVTQTVFSINLTAEAARLAFDRNPQRVPAMLDRLKELGHEALAEMRSLVDELRPRAVAQVGLRRSLEKHLAMRRRRDQLKVAFQVSGEEHGEAPVKEALFRTAQEALNNVLRHAGVSAAEIDLVFKEEEVILRVRDRGCGFSPNAIPGGESFGLINMRERVEAVGGEFRLRTASGDGTEIEARVPLERGGQG